MKYLVTGGTGFIGRSLVRALLSLGHEVRVYDDDSRGNHLKLSTELKNPKLELVLGDIRDENKVAIACQGVDSVLHLAYINGTESFYKKPDVVLDVGVRGMLSIIAGCQKAGVRELLTMSSSEVYQDPPRIPADETVPLVIPDVKNPRFSYSGGKIISELLTLNFGRNYFDRVMIVRPHNVYGPDMGFEHVIPQSTLRLMKLIQLNGPDQIITMPIQGDGNQQRHYVLSCSNTHYLNHRVCCCRYHNIVSVKRHNSILVIFFVALFNCSAISRRDVFHAISKLDIRKRRRTFLPYIDGTNFDHVFFCA